MKSSETLTSFRHFFQISESESDSAARETDTHIEEVVFIIEDM